MPLSYDEMIRAQAAGLQSERARAAADLEQYRLTEDADMAMYSANTILEIDAKLAALDNIARSYVTVQHQPQSNRYGLTKDEVDIANGMFSGDRSVSDDERHRVYAENKRKLQIKRATGEYRDDQGTVRR